MSQISYPASGTLLQQQKTDTYTSIRRHLHVPRGAPTNKLAKCARDKSCRGETMLGAGRPGLSSSCSFFFLMSKPLTSCTSEPLYKNNTHHNHKQYHTDQGKEWGEVCLLVLILPVSCLRLVLPEGCRGSIGRETQKAPAGIGKWGRREGAQEVVQGRLPEHGAGHAQRSLARAMAAALSQQGSGLVGGWAAPHSGCPGVRQLGGLWEQPRKCS